MPGVLVAPPPPTITDARGNHIRPVLRFFTRVTCGRSTVTIVCGTRSVGGRLGANLRGKVWQQVAFATLLTSLLYPVWLIKIEEARHDAGLSKFATN